MIDIDKIADEVRASLIPQSIEGVIYRARKTGKLFACIEHAGDRVVLIDENRQQYILNKSVLDERFTIHIDCGSICGALDVMFTDSIDEGD